MKDSMDRARRERTDYREEGKESEVIKGAMDQRRVIIMGRQSKGIRDHTEEAREGEREKETKKKTWRGSKE